MLKLVVKDLVTARLFLLVAIPLYALQLATMSVSPPAAMAVTLLFTAVFAFGSIGIEEAQGTEGTWCSLPVDRRQIVLARYVTTLLGVLVGLGISWAINRGSLGLHAQATAFFTLLGAASLFLPGYFRFGAGKALMIFSVLVFGVIVLPLAIGAVIAWSVGGSATGPGGAADEQLALATAWFEAWGTLLAGALVSLALLVTAASAALAVRFCEARDL